MIKTSKTDLHEELEKDPEYRYRLLSRLQSDNEYYLGHGNRNARDLWAGDEVAQIAKMRELYDSFLDDMKPEWITLEDIDRYEQEMIKTSKVKNAGSNGYLGGIPNMYSKKANTGFYDIDGTEIIEGDKIYLVDNGYPDDRFVVGEFDDGVAVIYNDGEIWGEADPNEMSAYRFVGVESEPWSYVIENYPGYFGVTASVKKATQGVTTIGEYYAFCSQKRSEGWMIDGESLFFTGEGNQFVKRDGDIETLVDVELLVDDDAWGDENETLVINNTVVHGDGIDDTHFSGASSLTDAFRLADKLTEN